MFHLDVNFSSFVNIFFINACILAVIPYAHVIWDLGTYWESFIVSDLVFRLKMQFYLSIIEIIAKLVCNLTFLVIVRLFK